MSKEGTIHINTFTSGEGSRVSMTSMATGVAELGVAIYEALDWSMSQDVSVERILSPELENVIDVMTSADDDIELLGEGNYEMLVTSRLCENVLELCRHHLALPNEAADHYQQVCRALVAEALELSNLRIERNAAIKVQAMYRGWRVRSEYLKTRKATVMIQSLFRGALQKKKFLLLNQTALFIQRQARANKQRDSVLLRFNSLKDGVHPLPR